MDGPKLPNWDFLNVTSQRTILFPARPQSAGLATEPFFESYRGSSLMPKETVSPQQLTEKGGTWGFGNHMNVHAGKWTRDGPVVFSQSEGFREKEGEKCCWKQDHLEWTAGLNPKQTGGWSCKWRPQSRTQGLVSLQKLNISKGANSVNYLTWNRDTAHQATAWLSSSKNLSLGLPVWFWPTFKACKNSLCDGTTSRKPLTGLTAVFRGQESHQSHHCEPFQGGAEPTWWRINSLLSSKRISSSGQKLLPILSSSVTTTMLNK